MVALEEYEDGLHEHMRSGLESIPGIRLYSNAARRTPTETFTIDGHSSEDISVALGQRNVSAPASNFYALEVSRHLGLGDEGGVRVGLAPYSTIEEIDRLIEGLRDITA
jgi:selenocysteine lyase/cysteine desulfurase